MVTFGSKITAPQAAAEGEAVVLDGSGKVPQGLLPEMSGGGGGVTVISEDAASPQWIYDNLEVGDLIYIDTGVITAGGYWTTFFGTCTEIGDNSFTVVGSGMARNISVADVSTYHQIFKIETSNQMSVTGTYVSGTNLANTHTYLGSTSRVILYKFA